MASEGIAETIKKSSKPIIAYIGDKGLDESYLIASSADSIIASQSSSIGGIGLSYIESTKYSKENLTGVYNEEYLKIKKSDKADLDNLVNGQKMIDQDYTQFIKKIAENKDMNPNDLSKLAYGKKYNGNEAKNLGLIDEIGNKNKAIKNAIVKLTVNKKTYTVKTNSKGAATFSIKLTKKGRYNALFKYGDNSNFKSSTKKIKIIIK